MLVAIDPTLMKSVTPPWTTASPMFDSAPAAIKLTGKASSGQLVQSLRSRTKTHRRPRTASGPKTTAGAPIWVPTKLKGASIVSAAANLANWSASATTGMMPAKHNTLNVLQNAPLSVGINPSREPFVHKEQDLQGQLRGQSSTLVLLYSGDKLAELVTLVKRLGAFSHAELIKSCYMMFYCLILSILGAKGYPSPTPL